MWWHCIVLVSLLSSSIETKTVTIKKWKERIVNGRPTTLEKHPYLVSLQTLEGEHFCGGSIISKTEVLTAANCLERIQSNEDSTIFVHMGFSYREGYREGVIREVIDSWIHELYNSSTKAYDVAILKLSSPVEYSHVIHFIKLSEETPETGIKAIVSGWDGTCHSNCYYSASLLESTVTIVGRKDCVSVMPKKSIPPTMLCAFNRKSTVCSGDSGGPLVVENRLVGIVSFNECNVKGAPSFYTDVAEVHDWILKAVDTWKSI